MLNIELFETENSTWNQLQQPVHGASLPGDYLQLLAALDEGWSINEAAYLLAGGRNDESRGYLLTLTHRGRALIRRLYVAKSLKVDALLEHEGFPAGI